MSAPDRIWFAPDDGEISKHGWAGVQNGKDLLYWESEQAHHPNDDGELFLRATPAREHADELAEALREVKADCEARAVSGVVPIGRSAWIALTDALAKLEKEEGK
ncbi:hypothetical protein N6L27_03690 [Leisingera sp. SS27]|uniref:hypothetical protein n=1 Tax=Leisingera sp. SS27 TaxID=2979462 RepID=UPI00232F81C3|nr:hypothetical protein [Leisingera sp. SS27]MDC0657093.1 hypothetical protein [Leisingera sp. SS27]